MGKEEAVRRLKRTLAALLCALCIPFVLANPIVPRYLSEIYFTSGSWVLEVFTYNQTLDGWSLSSRAGTVAFKPGLSAGRQYVVLTPDSMLAPLSIDPLGDSLTIQGPWGSAPSLRYGPGPGSEVQAPGPGTSICYDQSNGFFYLDSTPTLGGPNDSSGAMATVSGVVKDSATQSPLPGALIWLFDANTSLYAGASGEFAARVYAHNVTLSVFQSEYESRNILVPLVPGQAVDTIIYLRRLSSVPGTGPPEQLVLCQNYPNPFNPSTTIAFSLPVASKVTVNLYDMLGREIVELMRGYRPRGRYQALWDGNDVSGAPVCSGIYLARFHATDAVRGTSIDRVIKLLLIR
jgi:hypothetical protein